MQAACSIDNHHVATGDDGFAASFLGQPLDQCRARGLTFQIAFIQIGADCFGNDLELFTRGGTIDVDRDQQRAMAALFQPRGQLAGSRRLAGALQASHQNDCGRLRCKLEASRIRAQHRDQFVANNLDDLLGWRKRGQHFLADGLGANVLDQVFDDVQVDVGFEQRKADIFERLADIFLGDGALAAQIFKGALKFF